ncbi:hypothetical protein M130_2034 [Bacteroides fragilis str. S6R6]|nr:hypothetical protein M130_2034 [Bacteroides fragilis str. S6R6]
MLLHRLQIITGEIKKESSTTAHGNRILPYTLSVVMLDGHHTVFFVSQQAPQIGRKCYCNKYWKKKNYDLHYRMKIFY